MIIDTTSLKAARECAYADFRERQTVGRLTKKLCKLSDELLIHLWNACDLKSNAALIAVGGFGRGSLFPYSDIDILILLPADQKYFEEVLAPKIEKFVAQCWDTGLEIGSSVRTVAQCISEAENDITVRTSLLESRLICGKKALFNEFESAYEKTLDPKSFFQAKLAEQIQRHYKYQDTPYSLEPNCKESPGGLRDLQVLSWVSKAAHLGNTFKDLHIAGLITQRELTELNRNQRFLETLRANLHLLAGRRQDVLAFDLQAPLAAMMGLEEESSRLASEAIMRRYYWAAKAVTQLNDVLLQNIEALLFPQESKTTHTIAGEGNAGFIERQGVLDITDLQLFDKHPEQILRTFLVFAQTANVKSLSANIFRALYNARQKMDSAWRKDPVNRALFMQILKEPDGVSRAFQLMNRTSVLGRYLPAFRRIVGQMQHDLFHIYTVDQHILMVLRNVRRFMVVEHTHEFPFCSGLIANFQKPWLLIVAALFHDIAKGRGGDHSALGKADVRQFAKDHGIDKTDTELLVWLVAEHLNMSQFAQKQDITDPDVVQAFAKKMGDERHLTALYLLTVADVRGTSPKVWNAWKAKLLEDLYRVTLRVLGGAKPNASSDLALHQEDSRAQLRLNGIEDASYEDLWKKLDVAFFLRQEATDIAWLTRHLFDKVDSATPVVRAKLSLHGEGLQVAVYVKDREDLFARICAYFERHGFSIWDARVHTTRHGYALDTFQISGSNLVGEGVSYRDLIALVEYELTEALQSDDPLPLPSMGRLSRQSRTFPIQPRVHVTPDERGHYYALSLSASDRTGLLYVISRVLAKHQVSLHTARINTLGERVEDIFLLDAANLSKNPKLQILLETELLEALST
ncbi:bifunctional uridylyltransferase/uridylyl-removing enzyme [Polynucleobacter sp. TUM22923]|jgi:[protein-PII] uridylyltransferase|uniref:[protein-PII] uridylyltransferase n=1 Tax=Polynucleobacter sp. TUM22923 TaxID=3022126 RepID=UPI0025734FB7|nr:[protein-PII] uridylyltransferase [Polynucleobacter sp. TUM22923]BDX21804.1 bifunctional uridylyltransferase/uridylyl-removing enzyme [Polynucleobacter sp. TUM22923]